MNQHISSAIRNAVSAKLGEIEEYKKNIATQEADIDVLSRAIAILDPTTSLSDLKPRRTRKNSGAKKGEVSNAVVGSLKQRECSFDELLHDVLQRVGVASGGVEAGVWAGRVRTCLQNLRTQKLVESYDSEGGKRYRLIPPKPT